MSLSLQVPQEKSHQRIRSADYKIKESLTLAPQDAEKYRNAKSFDDILALNVDFLEKRVTTSPFTVSLQTETSPLIKQLSTANSLGFLTVCSSPGRILHDEHNREIGFQKAQLQGFIKGEERMEAFENLINQKDLVCFYQACNTPGYHEEENDERLIDVSSIQIPVTYKYDRQSKKLEVDEWVTAYNWLTHLKTSVAPELYEKLAHNCFNVYIIDPVAKRAADDPKDGLLEKVIDVLKHVK